MGVVLIILLCTTEAPYILPAATGFLLFYPLTTFVWVWVSFQTTHWFVSCPATTTYLCWLRHSPLLDKEIYFVCLFTVAFLSATVWIFSFTNLSWNAPSGSNLSFSLLGGMSSQQDISSKRV